MHLVLLLPVAQDKKAQKRRPPLSASSEFSSSLHLCNMPHSFYLRQHNPISQPTIMRTSSLSCPSTFITVEFPLSQFLRIPESCAGHVPASTSITTSRSTCSRRRLFLLSQASAVDITHATSCSGQCTAAVLAKLMS